jgi:hypothetical protein
MVGRKGEKEMSSEKSGRDPVFSANLVRAEEIVERYQGTPWGDLLETCLIIFAYYALKNGTTTQKVVEECLGRCARKTITGTPPS